MERNENGFSEYNFNRNRTRNNSCPGTGDIWQGEQSGGNGNMIGGVTDDGGMGSGSSGCSTRQLAMVYSPHQCFRMLYSPEKALVRGTLFEELDKPLEDCVNG